jgi:hypothetical protein
VLVLVGCQCQRRERDTSIAAPSARPARPKIVAPDLSGEAFRSDTRFARDPRWVRAAQGAPIDLELLAKSEGASGLMEAAELGGKAARIALAALPYAPDAQVGVGRVCDWLAGVESRGAKPFLEAIHGVAAHPPTPTEPRDPTWKGRCDTALADFLARGDIPPATYDLADSARRLIDEHDLGNRPNRG